MYVYGWSLWLVLGESSFPQTLRYVLTLISSALSPLSTSSYSLEKQESYFLFRYIFFLCMILDQCPIFFQSNSFKVKLKDKLIGKSQCISPRNKKPFSIFWGPQLYLYAETPGIPPSDQAEFLVHVESNSYLEKDVLACETLERRWREGVGSDAETKKFGMRGPQ